MNNIVRFSLLLSLLMPVYGSAQSIVNTVHNLSVTGPGSVKATSEQEICIFCHVPHNSRPDRPLWNRSDPGLTFTLYNSSTTHAVLGQPDGASILCLSCHDGTIALGSVISRSTPIVMAGYDSFHSHSAQQLYKGYGTTDRAGNRSRFYSNSCGSHLSKNSFDGSSYKDQMTGCLQPGNWCSHYRADHGMRCIEASRFQV